jgi:putative transcriptional regulator
MKETVVNQIREQRVKVGITQAELAVSVGVSRQSIISIEKGRYIPSLQLALRFAEFFDCTVDKLFQRRCE